MDETKAVEVTIVLYLLDSAVWLRKMSQVSEQETGQGRSIV